MSGRPCVCRWAARGRGEVKVWPVDVPRLPGRTLTRPQQTTRTSPSRVGAWTATTTTPCPRSATILPPSGPPATTPNAIVRTPTWPSRASRSPIRPSGPPGGHPRARHQRGSALASFTPPRRSRAALRFRSRSSHVKLMRRELSGRPPDVQAALSCLVSSSCDATVFEKKHVYLRC